MDVLRRTSWLALALAVALPALPALAAVPQAGYGEYEVKAAFLYNFAKFVEWPAEALGGAGEPLVICVLGEDPFGDSLDAVVRGETMNGRPLTIHRTRDLGDLSDCHVLFLPRAERERLPEVLSVLRGKSVLITGEGDGFLTRGGMIRFVLEESRVRFEINRDAAERSGLKLSSKLLRLARAVYPQER